MVCGLLIDARMYGDKKKDHPLQETFCDVYWLGWYAFMPYITTFLYSIGVPILSWQSVLTQFGMSVVWDLGFVWLESQRTIWVAPLPKWLTIPNILGKTWTSDLPFLKEFLEWIFVKHYEPSTKRFIIGFTKKQLMYFHLFRVCVLAYSTIL
jgi:hypothetical protein